MTAKLPFSPVQAMQHLIVDGCCRNLALLRDKEGLCAYLERLVKLLGMQVMGGPIAVKAAGFGPEAGATAIVVISESHISVHGWPERVDYNVNVDVFSCRPFDHQAVLHSLEAELGLYQFAYRVLQRPFIPPSTT